ncbi:MAG: hypothetical protein JXJ04_04790 [Spirochaetales bacterium]|nr:hypothetical protein [Spirochaetales bacterium]
MKKSKMAVLWLLPGLLVFSCRNFQNQVYDSTPIIREQIGSLPETFQMEGLTWIASEKAYCIPTSLQMIGEWACVHEPIEYYNWLMAFSYGGFHKDQFSTFMPISDPMRGIIFASPYLGLKRILYASADQELFVKAVKNALYTGYPVMIMYDYNCLTDDTFFFPHAAVLTGYTEDSFIYYEPGFHEEFTPDAGMGRMAPISSFLTGIKTLQRNFGASEGYSFMIFEKAEKKTDTAAVWKRNSEMTKGINIPFIGLTTGAKSCLALEKEIRTTDIPEWGWKNLLPVWFRYGVYSRRDNADFIEAQFSSKGHYGKAASLLRQSSEKYGEIMAVLENPEYNTADYKVLIPGLLKKIARIETDLSIELNKLK